MPHPSHCVASVFQSLNRSDEGILARKAVLHRHSNRSKGGISFRRIVNPIRRSRYKSAPVKKDDGRPSSNSSVSFGAKDMRRKFFFGHGLIDHDFGSRNRFLGG